MKEVTPPPELQSLFDRFHSIGGVVDYVLIEPEGEVGSREELHKVAAVLFLETITRRWDHHYEQFTNIWWQRFLGLSRNQDNYIRLSYEPHEATGNLIDVETFLGEQVSTEGAYSIHDGLGYQYAFTRPPYRLSASADEVANLYNRINCHLFDAFTTELEIFDWSTDWSNYFDAGHEWWGSYLWTIWNAPKKLFIGVGASTTD